MKSTAWNVSFLSAKKRFQMLIAKRASTSEIRNPTASCRKFVRITFASILSVTGRRRWGEREEIVQQMLGWQKVELTVVGMMAFVPWSRVSSQSPAISHSDLTHSPDLLTQPRITSWTHTWLMHRPRLEWKNLIPASSTEQPLSGPKSMWILSQWFCLQCV